jgi:hypothetical protein
MNIDLIDLNRYPNHSALIPVIEELKKLDIVSIIEELKKTTNNKSSEIDREFWHHITTENDKIKYYGDWNWAGEDDESDLSANFKGDWRYVKFKDPSYTVPKNITTLFHPYLSLMKDIPYEAEIHSIVGGARIEDHRDNRALSIGESPVRNLLIALDYPTGISVDNIGMHIENKAFTPEDGTQILFDAQRIHGAWNRTDKAWTMVLFYIPVNEIL